MQNDELLDFDLGLKTSYGVRCMHIKREKWPQKSFKVAQIFNLDKGFES